MDETDYRLFTLWDDERRIKYYDSVEWSRGSISRQDKPGAIFATAWPGSPFFGIRYHKAERIDTVLRQCETLSVRDEMEIIDSEACYVIDAKNPTFSYAVWMNPNRGYSISRAVIKFGPGTLGYCLKMRIHPLLLVMCVSGKSVRFTFPLHITYTLSAAETVLYIAKSPLVERSLILPLRKETAVMLKELFANKLPNTQIFPVPDKPVKMFRADLEETEVKDKNGKMIEKAIPYVDDSGLYADFHSLRHTTGTLLAMSGAHPKTIQSIMRHCDINLTMSRYTHIFKNQESEAISKLPDLSQSSRQKKSKGTGTDG